QERLPFWQWSLLITLISLAILISLGLTRLWIENSHRSSLLVNIYWFSAFLGAITLIFLRRRALALVLFLVMVSVPSYIRMHSNFHWRNTEQLKEIQYIIDNTATTDTVMDGFTGTGVFRPDAYFYRILPWDVRLRLTEEDRHELLKNLQSGHIAPE